MDSLGNSLESSPVDVVVPTESDSITPITVPSTPFLQNGDRLTRREFERRYHAMPSVKKAQLIEGIVYMPSPVRHDVHGQQHNDLGGLITYYRSKTPGLISSDDATVRLDQDNEPQPDLLLMLPEHAGGDAYIGKSGYIEGPPELVCEVSASTVSIDLHDKKNSYRRNGVKEYLVVRTEDQQVDWFELREGSYEPKIADDAGLLQSTIFPGLCLDPAALLAGDLPKLFAAIDNAVQSEKHKEFVEKLIEGESEPD